MNKTFVEVNTTLPGLTPSEMKSAAVLGLILGGYPEYALELAQRYKLTVKLGLVADEDEEMFHYSFSSGHPRYEQALEALSTVLGSGPSQREKHADEFFREAKGDNHAA